MSLSSDNSLVDDNVDFSDSTNEKNCATSRELPRRTAANADTEAHADRYAVQSASGRACWPRVGD